MNKKLATIAMAAAMPIVLTAMAMWDVGTPVPPPDHPTVTGSLPVSVALAFGVCAGIAYIAGVLSKEDDDS